MNETNVYQYFTQDLISHILELAQSNQQSLQIIQKSEFDAGYNFAMYEVISLIFSQAKLFQLDLKELGLNNIHPEQDLLFKNLTTNKNLP